MKTLSRYFGRRLNTNQARPAASHFEPLEGRQLMSAVHAIETIQFNGREQQVRQGD
jgi:hypothetical protein